jgi:antitoxin HicB
MRYEYPVKVSKDEDGRHLVVFPDVPEAGDDGATLAEAMEEAEKSLLAALQFRIKQREPIPQPSPPRRGQRTIALPALAAAKLALYQAMIDRGLNTVSLCRMLAGESETEVRRLLDLSHNSRISYVEAALAVLGQELVVETRRRAA